MPIIHWPQGDQPREKLFINGAQNLTDSELIAIMINTGLRGLSALDIAKSLIATHGSLKNLIDAQDSTCQQKGIGKAKQAVLKAAVEIGRRYFAETVRKGQALSNSRLTRAFLADRLKHQPNEVFACIYMDNHLRLIQYEEHFHGTINEANVYPREIVRYGLKHNAAKVILAHNHPSGIVTPSHADQEVTRVIQKALALVDIEVVDHVIIGADAHFSFAENQML